MNIIQIDSAENIISIDNWQEYRRDGEQFLRTASAAHEQQKKAFSPDTIYNLTCMGIEKIVMAFLMHRGDLAENHTMGDLLRAIEQHLGPNPGFAQKMQFLDSFQEICDLDTYNVQTPTATDIETILAIGEEVREMLTPYLTN
ncbi:HEPN domain-containing protein [Desulfogranum marinum]|jgi:hypothetical protein|uniref:HEPN domain-containing protein n=1 Tax=Desulfogranum marinum TaxID=453220 RepID=UPI0019669BBB|nr:HEPN domain-containing protein [Desulfogranum marinum]MBM9511029.1 HEPN domain-containing protein [Desulfogranum marinum]